ncbi:MAG: D-alanyl-D-alanine carboxypeptidase [Candidatus Midichloriaceae bacterium]|jgi:D-alanyl-D-alanine carboxypeptidase
MGIQHMLDTVRSILFLIIFQILCLVPNTSYGINKPLNLVPSITHSSNYSGIVMNYDNMRVLYNKNADKKRYPASLVKMMTLYITFEALKNGKLKPAQKLIVSKRAASQPKSNLDLKAGEKIEVRQAIRAVIIKSANDAAVTLGEGVALSESKFVDMMNKKAKQLKMYNTKFMNAHGLHDEEQYTTARDMAKLAIALKKNFNTYYHLFSVKSFIHKGKEITGHNKVMDRYKCADGLKTGYIRASGFNLATTAKRPEGNLVAIVMGGQTARIRDDHMINILENTYKKLGSRPSEDYKNTSASSIFKNIDNTNKKNDHTMCWDLLEIH